MSRAGGSALEILYSLFFSLSSSYISIMWVFIDNLSWQYKVSFLNFFGDITMYACIHEKIIQIYEWNRYEWMANLWHRNSFGSWNKKLNCPREPFIIAIFNGYSELEKHENVRNWKKKLSSFKKCFESILNSLFWRIQWGIWKMVIE